MFFPIVTLVNDKRYLRSYLVAFIINRIFPHVGCCKLFCQEWIFTKGFEITTAEWLGFALLHVSYVSSSALGLARFAGIAHLVLQQMCNLEQDILVPCCSQTHAQWEKSRGNALAKDLSTRSRGPI